MPRFLVLTTHESAHRARPMTEWDPADAEAHLECLRALNAELVESGELVEFTPLVAPELAKVVTAGGAAGTVVTDGPFGETKEALAGYQVLDVETEERALEIAARVSAAPGPGGVPLRQHIEVRRVMDLR
ncbi:YciI family protein [Pseudonocardia pini]|uniref:YciI family protein n=1 Tax=Pseudonocardia pini TaxID=2758030 RepID=UPI0015F0236F|nr:YciI family protein [Pseudonocardia pini]